MANNLSIPLNSHVNTSDDYIITDINTQEKNILNKKNTLKYKAVLSPMFYKGEDKVFTTSGHIITKTNNQTLTDENGRTYAVDNSFVIDDVVDISNLWSGELTSAISYGNDVISVWKGERDYTIVVSDFDNNILYTNTQQVNTENLLYFNVKLATFTREAGKMTALNPYLVLHTVYTTPLSGFTVMTIDNTAHITVRTVGSVNYLTGKDLYVLAYKSGDSVKLAIGTDDTDLRKRFTFEETSGAITLKYKYWGCLGSNGLVTGEPVLTDINSRGTGALSSKTIGQFDFGYLDNGIAYGQQISSGTDAQDIAANGSLGTDTLGDQNGATTWGGIGHGRYGTRAFVAGFDLENNIPLILSPSYVNTVPQNGNIKSNIYSLDNAQYVGYTVPDGDSVAIEQVDFSDSWGNVTWNNGTASITNGCNPFPYKYAVMNRAESKGRYWDYGPGWVRCYFRQGIIKSFEGNGWHRAFAEQYPTSIISFGLSSINGKNSVRQEYLDPVTLTDASGATQADTVAGWAHGSVYTGWYYKYHNIRDTKSHIWVNFVGADNLALHKILLSIPFNVDLVPGLNIKNQYFDGVYMSTSMNGTLLTSASEQKKDDVMLWIQNLTEASMYSNGLVFKGKANGNVQLTKVADYIYKTNTLTGNNLFIDSKESFYGQRGFIPYNGEEIITLQEMIGMYPPIDDEEADGNDTYYSAVGYNENMTDMKNRGVSYLLPAITIPLATNGEQVENLTYQLNSNKKEITKPLLYNQFTYKDTIGVDHFYTHSGDNTEIKYQTTKIMESNATGDIVYFGVSTYDNNKTGQVWYITSDVFYYPMGIASIVRGINYLASTIDMTDDYTVRLYRTQNVTFPVYNPSTEVYRGSTIFTIYGYNYSFDGQSIYYLGSGDQTSESSFACYALGMQFLANSGTEAYFYSPFEKRLYLFTGSNTLQIADSLSREGNIIDSIYSSCEQILYLLTNNGNIIAKSQGDMAVIENVDTSYHFEGTDSGMILANGFSYKKYRLWQTDETEWLPLEFETEYLGKNDTLFKNAIVDITFFRFDKNDTVSGKVYCDVMHDNMPKRTYSDFKITSKDWDATALKKIEFTFPNNVGKAFRFGIESDDYISIASFTINLEEVSQNTNAPKHR